MTQKTWFITGTSRGFGREWAIAALERGDKVAATARDTSTLDDLVAKYGDALLPIELDVTDRAADFAAVKQAQEYLGRLDIVINNAGYGHFGMVEELSEQDVRDQLETNLFGALWVTQAALPYLREQGSGHIIQVSSIGGISAFLNVGAYHASKWGLEGFSQALAQEVKPFGINVTLIEPGGYDTDWAGPSVQDLGPEPGLRQGPGDGGRAAGQAGVLPGRAVGDPGGDPAHRGRRDPAAAGVPGRGAAGYRDRGLRVPAGDLARVAAGVGRGPGLTERTVAGPGQVSSGSSNLPTCGGV